MSFGVFYGHLVYSCYFAVFIGFIWFWCNLLLLISFVAVLDGFSVTCCYFVILFWVDAGLWCVILLILVYLWFCGVAVTLVFLWVGGLLGWVFLWCFGCFDILALNLGFWGWYKTEVCWFCGLCSLGFCLRLGLFVISWFGVLLVGICFVV